MNIPSPRSGRLLTAFGVLLLSTALGGCVTKYGVAMITTEPSGAEVVNLRDDSLVGVTPVKLLVGEQGQARESVNVRVQKDGYRDKTTAFWVTLRYGSREEALSDPQDINLTLEPAGAISQ